MFIEAFFMNFLKKKNNLELPTIREMNKQMAADPHLMAVKTNRIQLFTSTERILETKC